MLGFEPVHKYVANLWSNFAAHGSTTDLYVEFAVELKNVAFENELCEVLQHLGGFLVCEVGHKFTESHNALVVGNVGVKGTDVESYNS